MSKILNFKLNILQNNKKLNKKIFQRNIFNKTGQLSILCTFNDDCFPNLLKQIELYWNPILKKEWKKYCSNHDKKPFDRYILSMFPYPSGSLHLGHSRLFTTSDVIVKYNMIKKRSVHHPIGWDSFGLPAENAAIQNKIDPNSWINNNISKMKEQLDALGLLLNFKEATSDTNFYKWTQWLFLKLYEKKLAYKTLAAVYWDPVDRTVLAKEQIDENGISWRSGSKVEKKFLKQWFFKTSAYIDSLYEQNENNQKYLGWNQLMRIQRSWFGEPNTFVFYFKIFETDLIIPVITNHPEILLQENSYLEVGKYHWLFNVNNIVVKNIFNGCNIPIILNKENIDEFYVTLKNDNSKQDSSIRKKVFDFCKSNPEFGGYKISKKFTDWLVSRQRYWGTPIPIVECNNCGIQSIPEQDLPVILPIIEDYGFLNKNHLSTEPTSQLLKLASKEWLNVKCPKCNKLAKRETDTLDTFVDSSWYFLRYASEPQNLTAFDEKSVSQPVWLYLGGNEHAKTHMFYARFMYYFLKKKNFLQSNSNEPFKNILFLGMMNSRTYNLDGKYLSNEEVDKINKYEDLSKEKLKYKYEKMSKSKMNGVSPESLVQKYGIDSTRYCVLGYTSSQKNRNWKGAKDEFYEGMRTLRKLVLTVHQWIYLKQLEKETKNAPLVRMYPLNKLINQTKQEALKTIEKKRNTIVRNITLNFEHQLKPGNVSKILQNYLVLLRKYILVKDVSMTLLFEKAIGDCIIMFSPFVPHIAEELWSAFASYSKLVDLNQQGFIKNSLCFQQNWPLIDENYEYCMEILDKTHFKGKKIATILLNKNEISKSNKKRLLEKAEFILIKKDILDSKRKIKMKIYDNYHAEAILIDITSKQDNENESDIE